MTVVILYLTLPLEQLVRILPWVVTSNQYLYSTAEGVRGEYLFFFSEMVGAIDSFSFTSHTYFCNFFSSPFTITVSR